MATDKIFLSLNAIIVQLKIILPAIVQYLKVLNNETL